MHSDFSITPQRKNLDVAQRRMVLDELLEGSNSGMLRKKGDYTRVAEIFHTNRWTIAKLLEYYKQQKDAGKVSPDLHSKQAQRERASRVSTSAPFARRRRRFHSNAAPRCAGLLSRCWRSRSRRFTTTSRNSTYVVSHAILSPSSLTKTREGE